MKSEQKQQRTYGSESVGLWVLQDVSMLWQTRVERVAEKSFQFTKWRLHSACTKGVEAQEHHYGRKRKVAGSAKITYTLSDIGNRAQLFAALALRRRRLSQPARERDSGCIKITRRLQIKNFNLLSALDSCFSRRYIDMQAADRARAAHSLIL